MIIVQQGREIVKDRHYKKMEMYMKKIEWVKLDTGFFEDEKIVLLLSEYGEKVVLFFLRLLTLAGKQNQGGRISFSENIPYSAKKPL